MTSTMLIIGAGQAGAQAVDTLRREGFDGRLVLVGDESALPYQRPPLSKKFLSGDMPAERLPFRHQAFYDEHRTELRLGARAIRLDPAARTVDLAGGERLGYERLLLCLGAGPRRLGCPGAHLAGIHYLRGMADATAIRNDLAPGARVVIIGGGYIGLETAATCSGLGCKVTVLEMSERLLNRVAAPAVSEFFAARHRARGITLHCNTRVVAVEGGARVQRVICEDGTHHDADLLIVGIGALPVTELAREAGLDCDNGILVDEYCRTSDPSVFAAGDCANHPSPHYGRRVRLESVDNAFEMAKAAALNMLGRSVAHDRVPWFWSDQFDDKLLIIGLSQDHDRLVQRGDPAGGAFSICYLKGRELLALEAVNHSKDYMAARRIIGERIAVDPDKLADPDIPLKEAV
jgi:3-phenylpropionate/trans-cinnamate dioxygenase ferredoxin reductase subunit